MMLDIVDIFVNRTLKPRAIIGNTETINKIRIECEEVYQKLDMTYDGNHYKGLDFIIDDNEKFFRILGDTK